jgi:hypothetical protein
VLQHMTGQHTSSVTSCAVGRIHIKPRDIG